MQYSWYVNDAVADDDGLSSCSSTEDEDGQINRQTDSRIKEPSTIFFLQKRYIKCLLMLITALKSIIKGGCPKGWLS